MRGFATVALLVIAGVAVAAGDGDPGATWSDADWASPGQAHRPRVRWWWPGGAVTSEGLAAEIGQLEALGFGGVEIQPITFDLSDTQAPAATARSVGTPRFLDLLQAAMADARRRGMRVDLTASSGWGLGARLDCTACGTHQLLMSSVDVTGPGPVDVTLPRPSTTPYANHPGAKRLGLAGDFDTDLQLLGVTRGRLGEPATTGIPQAVDDLVDVGARARDGRVVEKLEPGRFRYFAVWSNRTNTRLAGAAYPGDPATFRTIDHLDRRGFDAFRRSHFDTVAEALARAPDHWFVDSFEFLADLPWTPGFLSRFRREHGYDLRPFLPLLFLQDGDYSLVARSPPRVTYGETGIRVREDYEDRRAALFATEFVEPLRAAVKRTGAGLRLQALGGHGDYLDTYLAAEIPEAEDFGLDGAAEFQGLAASAAHLAGGNVVSNEAFVARSSSSVGLQEQDYLRMTGRAFAAGINQLVVHGRAYPTSADAGARWYPFESFRITTRLDETNPLWSRLPDLNRRVARLSWAMTRGERVAQVAWLVNGPRPPEFDRFSEGGAAELGPDAGPYRELSPVTRVLRQHGIGVDRISRSLLATRTRPCGRQACIGSARYELVLVDAAESADPEWLAQLDRLAAHGIPVAFVGATPQRARGYTDARRRDARVRSLMERLSSRPAFQQVATANDLGAVLRSLPVTPGLHPADPASWNLASTARRLDDGGVLLLFNGQDSGTDALLLASTGGRWRAYDPARAEPVGTGSMVAGEQVRVPVPAGETRLVYWAPPAGQPADP